MATIIAGIGQQNSFAKVIDIALDELGKTEGDPRRIRADSDGVNFVADRSTFDGKFESFKIQIDAYGKALDTLHTYLDTVPEGICEYIDDVEEGHTTVTLPAAGNSEPDQALVLAAVENLFKDTLIPEVWRFNGELYNTEQVSIELLFRALIQ